MAGTSLNDIVTAYAAANADEATYNAGKALLQATYAFDQIMAAGSGTYNEGLLALASTPPFEVGDALLLEVGDFLLLETADKILIDF